MFRILVFLILGIGVAACQTPNARVGSGPISLASHVKAGFEKYQANNRPLYFVITEDGRRFYYTFCNDGLNCIEDADIAITRCEKRAGRTCKIYAEFGKVVWKGGTATDFAELPENTGTFSLNWYTGSGGTLYFGYIKFETEAAGQLLLHRRAKRNCSGRFAHVHKALSWGLDCHEEGILGGIIEGYTPEAGGAGDGRDENGRIAEIQIASGIKFSDGIVKQSSEPYFSLKAYLKDRDVEKTEAFRVAKSYIGWKCLDDYELFETWAKSGIRAAFAYARDGSSWGAYACGWSESGDIDIAISSCDSRRLKQGIKSPCEILSIGDEIAWDVGPQRLAKALTDERLMVINWEGRSEIVTGRMQFIEGREEGVISLLPKQGSLKCRGKFSIGSGHAGKWSMECGRDLAATGTLRIDGSGKSIFGNGTDSAGKKVIFSVGGS